MRGLAAALTSFGSRSWNESQGSHVWVLMGSFLWHPRRPDCSLTKTLLWLHERVAAQGVYQGKPQGVLQKGKDSTKCSSSQCSFVVGVKGRTHKVEFHREEKVRAPNSSLQTNLAFEVRRVTTYMFFCLCSAQLRGGRLPSVPCLFFANGWLPLAIHVGIQQAGQCGWF